MLETDDDNNSRSPCIVSVWRLLSCLRLNRPSNQKCVCYQDYCSSSHKIRFLKGLNNPMAWDRKSTAKTVRKKTLSSLSSWRLGASRILGVWCEQACD